MGTIGGERGERTCLVKQGADLGGVVDVAGAQRGRDDPPGVGIHPDVPLAPGPTRARAVLLEQSLARSAQFKPGAVNQQVHGSGAGSR